MILTAVFLSVFSNSNRTLKVVYTYEHPNGSDPTTYQIASRKFSNYITYRMWMDFGVTGYLEDLTLLEFPDAHNYPTHYIIEANRDEYVEFLESNKEAQSATDF